MTNTLKDGVIGSEETLEDYLMGSDQYEKEEILYCIDDKMKTKKLKKVKNLKI